MKGLLERKVGDGRAREFERLDRVAGGAFQSELRQYSTYEARELEGVPRAYRHRDLRMLRQRVQNEVLVRRSLGTDTCPPSVPGCMGANFWPSPYEADVEEPVITRERSSRTYGQ